MDSVSVHNVKGRFRAHKYSLPRQVDDRSRFGNFCVREHEHYKYIVFDGSEEINVTGVRNFEQLHDAAQLFVVEYGGEVDADSLVVDNSTASGRLPDISRALLARVARGHQLCLKDEFSLSVRTRHFPSIVLRPRRRWERERRATITLFTSGKFIAVGGKNWQQITAGVEQLLALLQRNGYGGVGGDTRRDEEEYACKAGDWLVRG